ncbi:MAG: hypothetical protein SFZ23_11525 [Planctomycetota bacterium]|nr:hypothetical protein [Planctomycetota bacterium]
MNPLPRSASLSLLALLAGTSLAQAQRVWYVSPTGSPNTSGDSWTTALNGIELAIQRAQPGDRVWVRAGTYINTQSRGAPISMRTGVVVLGGFAGNETNESSRNPEANLTTITGDLNGDDDLGGTTADNANTVIDVPPGTVATAVLDGFTIRSARSQGIRVNGSFTLRNCTLTRHTGSFTGSVLGMANAALGSVLRVENCRFIRNGSPAFAGPLVAIESSAVVTIVNSSFLANVGGPVIRVQNLFASDSSFSLVNCQVVQNRIVANAAVTLRPQGGTLAIIGSTIAGNESTGGFAAGLSIESTQPGVLLRNSILWGNRVGTIPPNLSAQIQAPLGGLSVDYCRVQEWVQGQPFSGVGTSGADPRLADLDGPDDLFGTGDENVRLLGDSSAIDAGNNFYVPPDVLDLDRDGNTTEPTPFDLAGGPRFLDEASVPDTGVGTPPIVDIGAFERGQPIEECAADFNNDGQVDLFDYLDFVVAFGADC